MSFASLKNGYMESNTTINFDRRVQKSESDLDSVRRIASHVNEKGKKARSYAIYALAVCFSIPVLYGIYLILTLVVRHKLMLP